MNTETIFTFFFTFFTFFSVFFPAFCKAVEMADDFGAGYSGGLHRTKVGPRSTSEVMFPFLFAPFNHNAPADTGTPSSTRANGK